MNRLNILEEAQKIYVFEPTYDVSSATEQANKKKLDAFGVVAKFNLLNKPKDETVHAARFELRYEPFWYINSVRKVEYLLKLERKLEIDDEFATSIVINNREYEVLNDYKKNFGVSSEIKYSTLNVQYNCHRDILFKDYFDGLNRNIKAEFFEKLLKNPNYKYKEVQDLSSYENIISPKFSFHSVLEMMKNSLSREKVISHEILEDEAIVENIYLFYRPVYAFEFIWSHENKVGVIEIDGLNGEVSEKGIWLKEKVEKVITRDTLFDIGGEIVNGIVPGSGAVVRILEKITKNKEI